MTEEVKLNCSCMCHKIGSDFILTSMPPQPCCQCPKVASGQSGSFGPLPYFPAWKENVSPMVAHIQRLEERIEKLENYMKSEEL